MEYAGALIWLGFVDVKIDGVSGVGQIERKIHTYELTHNRPGRLCWGKDGWIQCKWIDGRKIHIHKVSPRHLERFS